MITLTQRTMHGRRVFILSVFDQAAIRIPHSEFRNPHSAFHIPPSEFRIPHSNFDSTELVAGRIPDTLYLLPLCFALRLFLFSAFRIPHSEFTLVLSHPFWERPLRRRRFSILPQMQGFVLLRREPGRPFLHSNWIQAKSGASHFCPRGH